MIVTVASLRWTHILLATLFIAIALSACSDEQDDSDSIAESTDPMPAATQPPTAYATPVLEVDASKPTAIATVTSTSATPVPKVRYADLYVAIRNGDAESVKYLLQAGADVNERNLVGDTPLQDAFRQGNLEIIELLVDAGADPYAEYPWGGGSVFSDAIEEGNLGVVRILANFGTGPVGNVLPFAIVKGNDEVVRILLEAGADPNATDIGLRTSLDIAITLDKTEVVRMLAHAGSDVNTIVSGRFSVGGEDMILGMAVKLGNLEIIRILVGAGADVFAKEPFGQSATEIAVSSGNAEIIEILKSAADQPRPPGRPGRLTAIPRGTDIDLSWQAPSEDGGSPVLGYRIEASEDDSNWEVLLADTGSDDTSYTHIGLEGAGTRYYRVSAINAAGIGQHVSATTEELCGGNENLRMAIISRQTTEVVQCVIRELGADVNATDDDGRPMLYWAILVSTSEVVQVLVDAGADVNTTDDNGEPMLLLAINVGDNPVELVKILVEAGADVNATDDRGYPILFWAIQKNNPEIVRLLVDAGADVDAKYDSDYPKPVLLKAIHEDNPEIVQILVEAGADVNATDDNHGKSMLYWAMLEENPEIVRILTEAGAKQ